MIWLENNMKKLTVQVWFTILFFVNFALDNLSLYFQKYSNYKKLKFEYVIEFVLFTNLFKLGFYSRLYKYINKCFMNINDHQSICSYSNTERKVNTYSTEFLSVFKDLVYILQYNKLKELLRIYRGNFFDTFISIFSLML